MHAPCKRKIYYREKNHSNIQKFPVRALYGLVKSSVRKKETGAGHIFISTNCGTRAADAKCPVAGISCGGAFLTSLGKEIKPQL